MARQEFRVPDVGEGLADVEVIKWLVNVGDTINENDPLAEIETDKAVVAMPAPATGRIIELTIREGERVKVGAVWLVMDIQDGQPAVVEPAAVVRASPVVRKTAQELGVPLERVDGSGPGGRITVEDVTRFAERQGGVAAPRPAAAATGQGVPAADIERVPLRGIRRRMAEAIAASARTVPHVSGFYEFDAAGLVALRERLKPQVETGGARLTFLPFLVKAVVLGLRAHPYLNASLDDNEQVILLKRFYHIGIATATPGGLVVPVLHHADRLSLLEIARKGDGLIQAARAERLSPEAVRGCTFTITNVGQAGGWFGTSLIRPPEVAILGVGRIEDRAVVRAGQVVARPVLPVSLTFDHRVIDGDGALAFIGTLRESLENPERLLNESGVNP